MHRIQGENVDTSEGKNLFRTEAPYTTQTPEWTNSVQEEIMGIVEAAGLETLFSDNDTRDQLYSALQILFHGHTENIKEIDDEDYTMQDNDIYDIYIFKNLTADRDLNLPTLADYDGKGFFVINIDGSYDAIITPEGAENINDWNSTFEITEKYGIVKVSKISDRWLVLPINEACIYEVSTETADTGLALDGSWDDVDGMTLLNGVYGKGDLYVRGNHLVSDGSLPSYVLGGFGVGKTSGDNAPDIFDDYIISIAVSANTMQYMYMTRKLDKIEYESDGSTIYMKAQGTSDEMNITAHHMRGATNSSMYIKFYRRY